MNEIRHELRQILSAVQTSYNLLSEIPDPTTRITRVVNLQRLSLDKLVILIAQCGGMEHRPPLKPVSAEVAQ